MARTLFRQWIAERARATDPVERDAIDQRIRDRFERQRAVLISDLSGFSRVTHQRGLLHSLELVHRMQQICRPAIEGNQGVLLKVEADNLLAVFDDADLAVQAALTMHEATERDARRRPPDHRIGVCVGIGFGAVLELDGEDVFGDQVNLASKLGEDVAEPGEILLTAAARLAVPGPRAEGRELAISGLVLRYWSLLR